MEKSEVESLRLEVSDLRAIAQSEKVELDTLKAQLVTLSLDRTSAVNEAAGLRHEVDDLKKKAAAANTLAARCKATAMEAREAYLAIRAEIEELEARYGDLPEVPAHGPAIDRQVDSLEVRNLGYNSVFSYENKVEASTWIPVWLKFIPSISFRTDNEPFKVAMERFTKKFINTMKAEELFESQGGPIILAQNELANLEADLYLLNLNSQIENEYGPGPLA
ncbi:hypothetical protein IFM89_003268 [Coptis chinensis]|uniref:beta-galactosidase n=1 Tax=Coptis chinensis TaxID=261450 RepID=A0A835I8G3_9MAGN|nr:hypothetical protein IFM89_003268 [Coptis chinensis]